MYYIYICGQCPMDWSLGPLGISEGFVDVAAKFLLPLLQLFLPSPPLFQGLTPLASHRTCEESSSAPLSPCAKRRENRRQAANLSSLWLANEPFGTSVTFSHWSFLVHWTPKLYHKSPSVFTECLELCSVTDKCSPHRVHQKEWTATFRRLCHWLVQSESIVIQVLVNQFPEDAGVGPLPSHLFVGLPCRAEVGGDIRVSDGASTCH